MPKSNQSELSKQVGRAIARHRALAGLTQEQVAESLDIGLEAVSRIERGIVMPNIARLIELADIFDCRAADLLSEASIRPDDQANQIVQLLSPLSHDDRQLLMEWFECLARRLQES